MTFAEKITIETNDSYVKWLNNPPLLLNTRINSMPDLKYAINEIAYMINDAQAKIRREIDDLCDVCAEREYLNKGDYLKEMIDRFMDSPNAICGINRLPIINDERHYIIVESDDREYAIYGIPVIIAGFDKKEDAKKFIKIITKFKKGFYKSFLPAKKNAEQWEEQMEGIPSKENKYLIRTAREIEECETLQELRKNEKI